MKDIKELISSLANYDEMEDEDGLNTIKNEDAEELKEDLNESSKNRVKVNVYYDGEKIDGFEFSQDLPDDYDIKKLTTDIEVI